MSSFLKLVGGGSLVECSHIWGMPVRSTRLSRPKLISCKNGRAHHIISELREAFGMSE